VSAPLASSVTLSVVVGLVFTSVVESVMGCS
jgi:hypothetical protein